MAALQPQPPRQPCPSCGTENFLTSRFCKACGHSLRAAVAAGPSAAETGDREMLRQEAAQLPSAKPPSNQILSNVLIFLAFLSVMVVVIYYFNRNAPKTISPFQGGPAPSAQRAQPATATPSKPVEGQVTLAPGMQAMSGTLFIILRAQGVTRGPPIAVRKINSPTFPVKFTVTSANTMFQGMPFTGPFDMQIRLDTDGDAKTKTAGDLTASAPPKGIKPGDPPVTVTLDTRL